MPAGGYQKATANKKSYRGESYRVRYVRSRDSTRGLFGGPLWLSFGHVGVCIGEMTCGRDLIVNGDLGIRSCAHIRGSNPQAHALALLQYEGSLKRSRAPADHEAVMQQELKSAS